MRRATLLTLVALAPAGCQEADLGVPAARTLPIIGGEPATGDTDATVLLLNVGGGFSSCSGSVIAPRVVVTAKHCLGQDPTDPEAPMGLTVLSRLSMNDRYQYEVVAGRTTEGDVIESGDFAVLVVDRDIDLEGSPYYELSRDQSDLRVGDEVKLTGFGLSDAEGQQGAFEKLQTFDEVADITSEIIYTYGRGACSGDSGGTLLDAQGRLAAVMVRADCAGWTLSERVDNFLDIVDWGLEESGICVPDPETCNGLDDDCDGLLDPGCAADGEACVEDRSCAEGLGCMGDGVCAASCAPAGLPTCGEGRYCDAMAPRLGRCRGGRPGAAPMGASCTVDADCASLACAGGLCRIGCAPDEVACPFGLACVADPELGGRCERPADRPEGPLTLGDPCGGHGGSCGAGLSCVGAGRDRYCAPGCDAGCPVGFHCRDDVCARGDLGEIGAPCGDDLDCSEGTDCVAAEGVPILAGASVCAAACDAGCPGGFGCVGDVCLPERGVVGTSCQVNEDCGTGLCGHFSDGARCTERCAGADACPTGTVCILQDDGVNLLCRPVPAAPEEGGCAVAPGARRSGGADALMGFALALALAVNRRRR
jgi:V8-like Glu-specific endopeptidase